MRYVERNPLRAGMVSRAEHWPYSSLRQRLDASLKTPPLTASPVECGSDWLDRVNQPQTDKEMAELKSAVQRGRPFGSESWQAKTALSLGLGHTFRKRGRRRKTIQ